MNENNYNMKLWNELPALEVFHKNGERYWAFFTNVNGEMVIGRLLPTEFDSYEKYEQANKEGAFACLEVVGNKSKYNSMGVVLCLTENCNCRCRYCFLDAENSGNTMPIELIHKSIDKGIELADGRELIVAAFGGEPGIEPVLLREMIDYTKQVCSAKNQPYSFAITTNGIIGKNVLDMIIENSFRVTISMDGIPRIQNFHRPLATGQDSYPIVEKTIKMLVASGKNKIKIRSTITAESVSTMPDQVKLLAELKLNFLHFGIIIPSGRGDNTDPRLQSPSAADFIHYLKESIELGARLNVNVIAYPYMGINSAPLQFCDGDLQNRIVVGATGDVSGCLEVQSSDHELFKYFQLGKYDINYNEIKLNENSKKLACDKCHNSNSCNAIDATDCKDCPMKFFCGSGCPNHNYRLTNDISRISNYSCEITKAILPYVLDKFYHKTYGV